MHSEKISTFIFFRSTILCLIFYNIITISILHTNNLELKNIFWKITPYDYKNLIVSPNYLSRISLLNRENRDLILKFLKSNEKKNFLDISFWNYKKTIENFDIQNKSEFEKSFYRTYVLSKNNPNNRNNLKKYFSLNYLKFSHEIRKKIIASFKLTIQ